MPPAEARASREAVDWSFSQSESSEGSFAAVGRVADVTKIRGSVGNFGTQYDKRASA